MHFATLFLSMILFAASPDPVPPPPPGISLEAMPDFGVFAALVDSNHWVDARGNAWSRIDNPGRDVIVRIDAGRRVTGILTPVSARSATPAERWEWRAFYPDGTLLAKGGVRDRAPAHAWRFFASDGTLVRTATYTRGLWR